MYYQDAKRKKIDTTAIYGDHESNNSASQTFNNIKSAHAIPVLSKMKKKILSTHSANSLNQFSEATTDDQHYSASQLSSGYGSIFSSSSSCSSSMKKQRSSAKKSDENFYNSFNFISPVKKPVVREIFNAKKILKEKSSSENVIRSSTPVQSKANNKKALWGRFRSLHPEKLQTDAEFQALKSIELKSFDESTNLSSFELSDIHSFNQHGETSANLSSNDVLEELFTKSLNRTKLEEYTTTGEGEDNELNLDNEVKLIEPETKPIAELKVFKKANYQGRENVDILSKLHEKRISLNPILQYLNFNDLLHLSEVSRKHRDIVRSIKTFESKRQSNKEAFKQNAENLTPSENLRIDSGTLIRKNKRKFGDFNITNKDAQPPTPPISPSRRKFHENQKVALSFKGKIKKCPLCSKPAKIQVMKIRKSPRKRKNLKDISTIRFNKTSGASFQTSLKSNIGTNIFYTTFPNFDKSPSTNSRCSNDSQSSLSSDDSSGFDDSNYESISYEFAKCSYQQCSFKFCPNCNSKSHPRKKCNELSLSPLRSRNEKNSVACTSQSLKNLKRLKY